MTLFSRRIGVIKGHNAQILVEESKVQGCEVHVEREVARDGC